MIKLSVTSWCTGLYLRCFLLRRCCVGFSRGCLDRLLTGLVSSPSDMIICTIWQSSILTTTGDHLLTSYRTVLHVHLCMCIDLWSVSEYSELYLKIPGRIEEVIRERVCSWKKRLLIMDTNRMIQRKYAVDIVDWAAEHDHMPFTSDATSFTSDHKLSEFMIKNKTKLSEYAKVSITAQAICRTHSARSSTYKIQCRLQWSGRLRGAMASFRHVRQSTWQTWSTCSSRHIGEGDRTFGKLTFDTAYGRFIYIIRQKLGFRLYFVPRRRPDQTVSHESVYKSAKTRPGEVGLVVGWMVQKNDARFNGHKQQHTYIL